MWYPFPCFALGCQIQMCLVREKALWIEMGRQPATFVPTWNSLVSS